MVLGSAFWAAPEEWKPRHALIPPTGVLNLGAIPPPEEVMLHGPGDSSGQAAWLSGLKQWRAERLTRMRYDDTEYERPELLWTRRVVSQNQPFSLLSNSAMSPSAREDCGRDSSWRESPPVLNRRLMVPTKKLLVVAEHKRAGV